MADFPSYGKSERDIEQAIVALKKGAHLFKYGRKGKPKFCPFRLSPDESSLIWISKHGKKCVRLASVSRILPGQRTAIFQRFLRPDKDYLSFSLIYNNGKRSLDVICKDKVEAEVWITGLKALISFGQVGRSKIDGWSDGSFYVDDGRDLMSKSPSDSVISATQDISSPEISATFCTNTSPRSIHPEKFLFAERSHVASENKSMLTKGSGMDAIRISVSSAPSTSSHGSSLDDVDTLGDLYVWGDLISEKSDVLLPKPLHSTMVLDVHHVSCGVKHAALVTRQGEVFTWGEEAGGRLGQGVRTDVATPRLVETLAGYSIDFVACGDFHTCAVSMSGELYTWGDGSSNVGLLGHGTNVSHWIPKRVSGPLEGLQVASVACGPWHTALVTSIGQLFTFGDGTFGVLGHGDRESVLFPKEVESLAGLRTIAVACGLWHTAAVVEVMAAQSSSPVSSGKLFTWGDGDKHRLGHGDKESKLKPTCISSLIDHNFHKVSCGHSITVALTTSGQVFTVGSNVYGQLGNDHSDGRLPCLVEHKLTEEHIDEISCGAFHVAVLTAKNEVYTWGKGANGRLGHGNVKDQKLPAMIESLKDRHVKYVTCGSCFTAAVCLHKRVSTSEQLHCSACHQSFGFTRKRHTCYNCGLVHCHSCSSRKAVRVAMASNRTKPYRVCDSCYAKLNKLPDKRNNTNKVGFKSPNDVRKSNKLTKTSALASRPVSPFSRKPSPPRSITPIPTTSGLSLARRNPESLVKTNELLMREVYKLRMHAGRSDKEAEEAKANLQAAKEVIKSLSSQLKERLPNGVELLSANSDGPSVGPAHRDPLPIHPPSSEGRSGRALQGKNEHVEGYRNEHVEQYEQGVYITLVTLHDGSTDIKRVRFSRRRFKEDQAEAWWLENRAGVYQRYNVHGSDMSR